MLEPGRREHHLLGGIGVQLLIVALMVFAYTQAIRQLRHRGELKDRLQEQLVLARNQLAKHGHRPDLAALQAQVAELKATLISAQALDEIGNQLEKLAREEYGVQGLQVRVSDRPTQTLTVPLDGRLDFEAHLHSLELSGFTTSRNAAALVSAVGAVSAKLLAPLVGMEMKRPDPTKSDQPVRISLRWLLAVSPDSAGSAEIPPMTPPGKVAWGWREEPFLSPLEHRGALKVPSSELSSLRLTGILWEPGAPTCVINGAVLKPGESVSGSRVVVITPQAVLVEKDGKELLLRLP